MKTQVLFSFLALVFTPLLKAETYQVSDWERQIIAACLILEAADQGEIGMQAVAAVIANRAGGDPEKYILVVKKPYAFSALNAATTGKTGARGYADHIQRASMDMNWVKAKRLVDQLYAKSLADVTYGADHYTRRDTLPSWSHTMKATAVIGDHLFFKARKAN